MSRERDEWSQERRLREAAETLAIGVPPSPPAADDDLDQDDAPRQRIEQQTLWVDRQIRAAMARGEFDNLPGAGKPLRLPDRHDPDWWVKGLIEREKITGVLPPALGLRKEDAELEADLDREATEAGVRRAVDDFNRRVVEARRQLLGGPPVVTRTRDPDTEVAARRERRRARRAARNQAGEPGAADQEAERGRARRRPGRRRPGRCRWWSRR
ncbi:MAG: DUF1992 domain-containing protein [Nocardioides sp.]